MTYTISTPSDEPHVAVLAFPFSSHAAALLTIIRHLAKMSPKTLFSFFSIAESNNFIFSQNTALPNIKPCNISDGIPEGFVPTDKKQENIELFLKATQENLREEIKKVEEESGRKVNCLATDTFYWFAADVAAEIGASWVAFWIGGSCSLSAHFHTDLIRETVGIEKISGRQGESLKFIPGMSKHLVGDLPEGVITGDLNSIFSRMLLRMARILSRADAVFINSFEEIELSVTQDLKSKLKLFLNLGPLTLLSPPPPPPDTYGCIPWLSAQEPSSVAYIGFGTIMIPPPDELVAIAEALESSGIAFLWSLKDNAKGHLPKGFIEKTCTRGKVVPWVPQSQVLAHSAIGVFVTHCGWNSLLESIVAGVPMVCRPFLYDQLLNGRTLENVLGIGAKIEGGVFTKEGLLKSFDKVMKGDEGKIMREKIRRLKEAANEAVGPKGSSTENMKTLLDVITRRN